MVFRLQDLTIVAMVFALLVAAPDHLSARGVFNPETFHLDNGMQVVVVRNHRAPVVTHMVWYRVGAIDEPNGQSGLAHLLEHLMFKGTKTRAPGEFSALVARHGGNENAFTGHDYTGFYQTIAKDRLGLMMELEADRMRNLVLTEAQVASETRVVLEERHMRVDNDPGAILAEQAAAVQFFNTNYKRPVIGWEEEIRRLSADDVRAFYDRWYHPGNAILVVAGDLDPEDVKRLATATYGKVPAARAPARLDQQEPSQRVARRVTHESERVQQPVWTRTYLAPSYGAGDSRQADALQVLAELVGGGTTGRLYRSLVLDRRVAVNAGAFYDPVRRGPGVFGLSITPPPEGDLAAVEQAADAVLADLRERGIGDDEVAQTKRRMLADAIYARDSLATGARWLGAALAAGLDIDVVEGWPERIEAITRSDVEAVARLVLTEERAVTSLLQPAVRSPTAATR